jgi:hypothetical protein
MLRCLIVISYSIKAYGLISIPNNLMITKGDIVEYKVMKVDDGKNLGLGLITTIQSCSEPFLVCVHPLCIRLGDDEILNDNEMILIEDENYDSIEILMTDVVSIVDDVYFSQRPIEDRRLNPHGEHSEDVWLVKTHHLNLKSLLIEKSS